MKKLSMVLMVLMPLFALPVCANTLNPLPLLSEGKKWICEWSMAAGNNIFEYPEYNISYSHSVNDIPFWDISEYRQYADDKTSSNRFLPNCFIGEKGGKLYFWDGNEEHTPAMFMDFALDPGCCLDFERYVGDKPCNVRLMVTAVSDTIFADSDDLQTRRCLHVSYESELLGDEKDVWVEGIGSLKYGITFPYYFGTTGAVMSLRECRNNDIILYKNFSEEVLVRPFVEEGKVWVCRDGRNYCTYIIQGDTIINSQTYKRLYQYQVGKELTYIGCLRDEATRVYWIASETKTETCLYDFQPQNNIFSYNGNDYYVSSDGYGRADGVFSCEVGKMEGDAIRGWSHWITGVGDLDGPILSEYASIGEQRLLYCRVKNVYLYKDNQYLEPTVLEDNKTWKVLDYAFNAPIEYHKLYTLSIIGDSICGGRTWKKLAITSKETHWIKLVREENKRIFLFDKEHPSGGIPLFDFSKTTGDEFVVHPGLVVTEGLTSSSPLNAKVCEDAVVFNSGYPYRAITLACEEEAFIGETDVAHTTWLERIGNLTFPFSNPFVNPDEISGHALMVVECSVDGEVIYSDVPSNIAAVPNWEEILSGINTPSNSSIHSPTLFDLQGRRLATPPARGVFIKNGKKVIR